MSDVTPFTVPDVANPSAPTPNAAAEAAANAAKAKAEAAAALAPYVIPSDDSVSGVAGVAGVARVSGVRSAGASDSPGARFRARERAIANSIEVAANEANPARFPLDPGVFDPARPQVLSEYDYGTGSSASGRAGDAAFLARIPGMIRKVNGDRAALENLAKEIESGGGAGTGAPAMGLDSRNASASAGGVDASGRRTRRANFVRRMRGERVGEFHLRQKIFNEDQAKNPEDLRIQRENDAMSPEKRRLAGKSTAQAMIDELTGQDYVDAQLKSEADVLAALPPENRGAFPRPGVTL